MKEKEDKFKLMKQILDEEVDRGTKQVYQEEIPITTDDIEVPSTAKITTATTTFPETASTSSLTSTPKTSAKAVSTVKFDDTSDVRLSRKVNILTISLYRFLL